jgi:hypothetical protein
MGLPKDRESAPHTSRDGRRSSRSPSRAYHKDDGKRQRESSKRPVRGASRHPKEGSKKRKLKNYQDDHIKEYPEDMEDRVKKPKSKKKKLLVEHVKEEVYHSGHSSRDDTPPATRQNSKESKKKSDNKKSRSSKRTEPGSQDMEMQKDGYGTGTKSRSSTSRTNGPVKDIAKMHPNKTSSEDNMETNQNSDTEQIKTLSIKRGNLMNTDRHRDFSLIQINTHSFKDGTEDLAPTDFVREKAITNIGTDEAESSPSDIKIEPPSIKMETQSQESLESKEVKQKDSSVNRKPQPDDEAKTEQNTEIKMEVKSETKSDVDSELEAPVATETNNKESTKQSDTPNVAEAKQVTVKKPKESSKTKSKKSKDREKEEKLRKIEKLQAEIRRLEKQQEEGLMVVPPELSRWERDDSEQDSDSKDLTRSRISSSISKPGLPRYVIQEIVSWIGLKKNYMIRKLLNFSAVFI